MRKCENMVKDTQVQGTLRHGRVGGPMWQGHTESGHQVVRLGLESQITESLFWIETSQYSVSGVEPLTISRRKMA